MVGYIVVFVRIVLPGVKKVRSQDELAPIGTGVNPVFQPVGGTLHSQSWSSPVRRHSQWFHPHFLPPCPRSVSRPVLPPGTSEPLRGLDGTPVSVHGWSDGRRTVSDPGVTPLWGGLTPDSTRGCWAGVGSPRAPVDTYSGWVFEQSLRLRSGPRHRV